MVSCFLVVVMVRYNFKMWSLPPVSHFFSRYVLLSLLLVGDSEDSVSRPVVVNRLAIYIEVEDLLPVLDS